MGFTIRTIGAPTPDFEALVDTHTTFCDGTAPAESCHRLPVSALFGPGLTVWTVTAADGALVGMGALKALPGGDGEVKSMHTRQSVRGQGVARAMLETILAEGARRGYGALWLETGAHPDFAPARRLYAAHGFVETGPFGSYRPDPHSVFMTRRLDVMEPAA
ncbi:MAG: GNAT family N-acetyltransferase [Roseivivax sp.]|nr:GNAT family N-acetyltransferase [Roseivivax sp.]